MSDDRSLPDGVRDEDVRLADGTRVRVARSGAGTPVVLVHGNFASRRWWQLQLADPPEGLELIAPDLPNFGASDPLPGELTMDGYAVALGSILDALDLDTVVLVGHSLGAAVVERFTLAAPKRVLGLMLIDGGPPEGLPRPEEHYALLSGFVGQRDGLAAALGPMTGAQLPAFWDALLDDAVAMAAPAYEGNARALGTVTLPPVPEGVAPRTVVVLHGGQDPLITADMAEATAAHWPGARLERWPNSGHSPQLDQPDRFADLLTSFAKEAAMP